MERRQRPSSDQLMAWQLFLRAHRALVAELDRELLERHELPLPWYDVLVQLEMAGRELTMGALVARLLISPSTCTRVVDRMVAEGLLARRADSNDARVRHVSLTASGRARLRAAAATHLDGIARSFGQFLDDDAGRLAGQLQAMLDALEAERDVNE